MSLLNTHELVVRALSVPARELTYVRGLLEAHEGLGFFVAKKGGDVLLVSSSSLAQQLEVFIRDLSQELTVVERDADTMGEVEDVFG